MEIKPADKWKKYHCGYFISVVLLLTAPAHTNGQHSDDPGPRVHFLQPVLGKSVEDGGRVELTFDQIQETGEASCVIVNCQAGYPVVWNYDALRVPVTDIENARVAWNSSAVTSDELTRTRSGLSTNGKFVYESKLSVCQVTSLDGGEYACHSVSDVTAKATRFHLFIQSRTVERLIWHGKQDTIKVPRESSFVNLPCNVDSTETTVQLFHRKKLVDAEDFTFDPRTGFNVTLRAPLPSYGLSFECRVFHGPQYSFDGKPDFYVIRVLPLPEFKSVPSKYSVVENQGSPHNLSCSDTSRVDIIRDRMPADSLSHCYDGLFTASAAMQTSGIYSCIRSAQPYNVTITRQSSIAGAQILHNWKVFSISSAKFARIRLKLTEGGRKVRCDGGRNGFNVEVEQAACMTEAQCAAVERTWRGLDNLCGPLGGPVWTDMSAENPPVACPDHSSTKCKIYNVERSGFVHCFLRERKNVSNCDGRIIPVLGGLMADESTTNTSEDTSKCKSVNMNADDHFNDELYFSGRCELVARPNHLGKISCHANRRSYMKGIQWHYSFTPDSSPSQSFIISNNSAIRGTDIRFDAFETFNGDSTGSTLEVFVDETDEFRGFLHCTVPRLNGTEDTISSKLTIAKIKPPQYNQTAGSPEEVSIPMGGSRSLNCTVDSYPRPRVTWYKQLKDKSNFTVIPVDRIQSDPKDLPSEYKDLSFSNNNQILSIDGFRLNHSGLYKCQAELHNSYRKTDGGASDVSHSDQKLFNVTVGDESSYVLTVVIFLVSFIGLFAVLAAIFYHRRFKIEKIRSNMLSEREIYYFVHGNKSIINDALDMADQIHYLPYQVSYEFPKDKLTFGKQLGSGAYGTVLKAEAQDIVHPGTTTTVAVKTVLPDADGTYFKALLTEIKVMIHIGKHLNVVSLLGAITANLKNRELFVIVEYCRYGNLQHYLHKWRKNFINQIVFGKIDPRITTADTSYSNMKSKMAGGYVDHNAPVQPQSIYANTSVHYQNSGGESSVEMFDNGGTSSGNQSDEQTDEPQPLWRHNVEGDYTAAQVFPLSTLTLIRWAYEVAKGMEYLASKRVFHGDLACRNILLAEGQVAKVADFGLARKVYQDVNYVKSESCPLPVKWMAIESLLRLEFSTQSDVWSYGIVLWEMFTLGNVPYPGILQVDSEFLTRLQTGYRLTAPQFSNDEIYQTMLKCWEAEPERRPSFEFLANFFQSMLTASDENDAYTFISPLQCNEDDESILGQNNIAYADLDLDCL